MHYPWRGGTPQQFHKNWKLQDTDICDECGNHKTYLREQTDYFPRWLQFGDGLREAALQSYFGANARAIGTDLPWTLFGTKRTLLVHQATPIGKEIAQLH